MIFLVYFDDGHCSDGYFSGYAECERYAMTTLNLSDAVIFNDYESAYRVVEDYGGVVISFETK